MSRSGSEPMGLRRPAWTVMAVCVMVAGCGDSGQTSGPPAGSRTFAEALEAEAASATSNFEREVLSRAAESGAIAAADYEEAVSRYLACTADAGYVIDAQKLPNGIYRWIPQDITDDVAYLDDTYACAEGTTMILEALYKLQVTNPDGKDLGTVAIECLRDNGVVDGSYTLEDFNADVPGGFADAPFDGTSEAATMCLTSLGLGVQG